MTKEGINGRATRTAESWMRVSGLFLRLSLWQFLCLIVTARINEVHPRAWPADLLARITELRQTRLHELLSWE